MPVISRGNKLAVLWGALDPRSDVLYICGEYLAAADSAVHGIAIRALKATGFLV
jgi:hypothetical protein